MLKPEQLDKVQAVIDSAFERRKHEAPLPKRIIAIYSPTPQSGKSVVARELRQALMISGDSRTLPLGTPIKECINGLLADMGVSFGTAYQMLYGNLKELPIPDRQQLTARKMMQDFGTFARDVWGKDFWIDIWQSMLSKTKARNIIVDDLRMPQEYERLKAMGAILVKVVRPDADVVNHATEGQLEDCKFDHVITNDGTLAELKASVAEVLYKLGA
jgi:hypothetical protein